MATPISVILPDGFERYTQAQRRQWAQSQIEDVALEMLADVNAEATPEQTAAYLQAVRPDIAALVARHLGEG